MYTSLTLKPVYFGDMGHQYVLVIPTLNTGYINSLTFIMQMAFSVR